MEILFYNIHGVEILVDSKIDGVGAELARFLGPFQNLESHGPCDIRISLQRGGFKNLLSTRNDVTWLSDREACTERGSFWVSSHGYWRLSEFASPKTLEVTAGIPGFHTSLTAHSPEDIARFLRWSVVFPLLEWMRQAQGKSVWHAASVSLNGRGLLIGGLPGAGKSSLAAFLCQKRNGVLLADNYSVTDWRLIYPLPETLRVTQHFMNEVGLKSESDVHRQVFGKRELAVDCSHQPSKLSTVIILTAWGSGRIRKIGSRAGIAALKSLNRDSGEMPEHSQLGLVELESPLRLAETSPPKVFKNWWHVDLDHRASMSSNFDRLSECISTSMA